MNTGTLVFAGAGLLLLGGSLFSLVRYAFVVAIPLALGGALLCAVPLFFARSVAPLHEAFDSFLGQPHRPQPFETDVASVREAVERLKRVTASVTGEARELSSPASPLASGKITVRAPRLEDPELLGLVFFLAIFVFLFSLYKLFRLAMAYLGCGLPWGRRARVEILGMQFCFKLRYPVLVVGDMVYDLSDAERDPRDPYRYQLVSGTVLQFLKLPRKKKEQP